MGMGVGGTEYWIFCRVICFDKERLRAGSFFICYRGIKRKMKNIVNININRMDIFMIMDTVLRNCNERHLARDKRHCCVKCTFDEYCPLNCQKCLDFIHNPKHAPKNAPARKYDCNHIADVYTCKYSYRYTSEMIYAFKRLQDIHNRDKLKVLSFGCGPCTDLYALEYLKQKGELKYTELFYRGIDYSKNVWKNIHTDIEAHQTNNLSIKFYYKDACSIIDAIAEGAWIPDLVIFQYVFSDMRKHTDAQEVATFIDKFADFFNNSMPLKTYIVLNDVNLGIDYGGGREYFCRLYKRLNNAIMYKGRFRDDNSRSLYYPRGYPYGDDSDGEFPENVNFFTWPREWEGRYSPFNTCASAQMLIKKEKSNDN